MKAALFVQHGHGAMEAVFYKAQMSMFMIVPFTVEQHGGTCLGCSVGWSQTAGDRANTAVDAALFL